MATKEKQEQQTAAPAPTNPNAMLDLSPYDYTKMQGPMFRAYNEMFSKLGEREMYDFEVYRVNRIRVERFKGVPNSPVDTKGFTLVNDKPVKTTRVNVKTAREFNGKLVIWDDQQENGFTVEGGHWWNAPPNNGEYYLLKKSTNA